MQFLRDQGLRFLRFLAGVSVHDERGQVKRFLTILGLAALLGLLLSPLAILATRSGNGGGTALISNTPTVGVTATHPPSATSTPKSQAGAPIKGLTDNPAYQWWVWPNTPQPDSWWGTEQTAQTLGVQVNLMRELGVKLFRVELVWSFVAPDMPGGTSYDSAEARDPNWSGYQWDRWDEIVQLTAAAGIQVVPQVVFTPDWASGVTTTTASGPNLPPQSAQYYGDFVYATVTRYKSQIHYWEMWNEPDIPDHTWKGTMQQYVDLILKPGYQSVKQVDPNAQVLLGGLAGSGTISKVYAAGGKPYFDIANFHAYYTAATADSTALSQMRQIMVANGDAAKPSWMTEFGMKTQNDGSGGALISTAANDEASQAQLIKDAYGGAVKVQAAFFYQLHDTNVYGPGEAVVKQVYWGLVSHDFTHNKLGFDTYKQSPGGPLPALSSDSSEAASSPSGAPVWGQGGSGSWWIGELRRVNSLCAA